MPVNGTLIEILLLMQFYISQLLLGGPRIYNA